MSENSNATDCVATAVHANPSEGLDSIPSSNVHVDIHVEVEVEMDENENENQEVNESGNHIHNHIHDHDRNQNGDVRIGTISSARFNILSTMVGGGCLSLPLAFQQSGNALIAPLMLLATGAVTDFCFRLLVASAVRWNKPHPTRPGRDTFESISSEAFGPKAYVVSMGLVVLMCFFGTVGYSVLLRDMMEPLNDAIAPKLEGRSVSVSFSEWLHRNFTMFLVVVLVTPFCTLRRLTALKDCGAASMASLLILGSCIVIRSVQCNLGKLDDESDIDIDIDIDGQLFQYNKEPWYTHLRLFPESWHDLLNALPLYISCFVCHYNILPVHNELKDPSPARVSWWLRSTTWFAVALYMVMGFAGSAYAHCTPTGKIQGNILLDFDENDPLLMVGRMCLAVTITLAFPMLVIPGRDIVVRSLILPQLAVVLPTPVAVSRQGNGVARGSVDEELREPLLEPEEYLDEAPSIEVGGSTADESSDDVDLSSVSVMVLLSTSVVIFWSAAALASLVSSIDVVWDLLGSSLSILMSYFIPAGTYLVITNRAEQNGETQVGSQDKASRLACWLLLGVSVPLMVVSTVNAIYNTFS